MGVAALFSTRAQFLVTFFGGIVALLILAGQNTDALGRMRKDLWLYCVGAAVAISYAFFVAWVSSLEQLPEWLALLGSHKSTMRFMGRAVALLVFAGFYLHYRTIINAAEMMGTPRQAWMPGIAAVVLGRVADFVLFLAAGGVLRLVS